jgi:hypothetical protein
MAIKMVRNHKRRLVRKLEILYRSYNESKFQSKKHAVSNGPISHYRLYRSGLLANTHDQRRYVKQLQATDPGVFRRSRIPPSLLRLKERDERTSIPNTDKNIAHFET